MNTPHIHHDLIIQWAKGATIQAYNRLGNEWFDVVHNTPLWDPHVKYRVKPAEYIEYFGLVPGEPKWIRISEDIVSEYYMVVATYTKPEAPYPYKTEIINNHPFPASQ